MRVTLSAHATSPLVVRRAFRLAAVRELQAVLQQGLYASATKGVQAMVYADLLVAAQQHDRSVCYVAAAVGLACV
jgi:hypothetical protein